MQDYYIKEADLNDCESLANLHRQSFFKAWDEYSFLRLLQNQHNNILTLLYKQKRDYIIAGFICTQLIKPEAEILSLAILNKYRGLGLGRILLQHSLKKLALEGCEKIFLEVEEHNKAAIYLYKKAGFKTIAIRKHYYETAEGSANAITMQRELI